MTERQSRLLRGAGCCAAFAVSFIWVVQIQTDKRPPTFREVRLDTYDPTITKVVEWSDGKYERYANGQERVTPFFANWENVVSPRKDTCPEGALIGVDGQEAHWTVCVPIGRPALQRGSVGDLPEKTRALLLKGRQLAQQHWGAP